MQSGGCGGEVIQSCLTLATPRTVACQAPLSMDFSRQEYWSSHSFHSPEYLPNPGIEGRSHRRQILYCLSYQGSPTATHIYLLWNTQCFLYIIEIYKLCLMAQTIKNLPTEQETWVWSLWQEDPLEKRMATHSSILAWRIPWTEEPIRLQSMGSQRARYD